MITTSPILFVSQAANLYGSERTLLTLLEAPLPPGYRPIVLCPPAGPLCDILDALHIQRIPWQFNRYSLRANPAWHLRFFLSFFALLKRHRPRAVVLVYEGNVPLLAAVCLAARVPYLRILQRELPQARRAGFSPQRLPSLPPDLHLPHPALSRGAGFSPQQPPSSPQSLPLPDRLAYRFARGIFCGAETLEHQLRRACPSPSLRTAVVRLPVRAGTHVPGDTLVWRRAFAIPPDVPLVGQFSRLHPIKGLDAFLRAAARVLPHAPSAHFLIGGGPDATPGSAGYLDHLRALAADLRIAHRVTFTGCLRDPLPLMRACDVVVQASHAEGVGLAPLEAILAGRPVIASDVDGLGELIRLSGGGLAFPSGDDAALASHILSLLSDPAARQRLAARGAQWIQRNCAPTIFRQNFWTAFHHFLGVLYLCALCVLCG